MTCLFPPSERRQLGLCTVARPQYFNVPKNEAEILDLSPNANTPESELKELLLSHDDSAKVCAIVGMSGVGKTTDTCALSHDRQVWLRYRDGIWFIQLGKDITLQDLRVELDVLVQRVCLPEFAVRFSKLLNQTRGFVTAVRELVGELENLDFLLILDNVWEENEAYGIVKQITNAVSTSFGRMKMLISTIRKEIAHCPLTNAVVVIDPKDPQGNVARRILCMHARSNPESLPDSSTSSGKAIEDILERCAGLPIALAVAGSYMRGTREEEGYKHSWIMLRDSLSTNAVRLGQNGSNEHRQGLFACLEVSMRFVENKWSSRAPGTARALLSSLCIFPKQIWIPLETLQRKWDTKPGQAELFIEMLSDYSIVSCVGRKGKRGMRAHDLVLDYCSELAREDGMTSEWHKRLIQGYSRDLGREDREVVPCVNWWSEKLSTDGYIRTNVVRHLLGCGMINEAVLLVCDYRWMQLLNEEESRLPFQQCISDLKRIKQSLSTSSAAGSELERGVSLLRETMELCVFACARNRVECPFQLYGRLSSLEPAPELFVRCMWSIEAHNTGQWAKPTPGVLRGAGGSLKGTVNVPFAVRRMEVGVEEGELVLGGRGGEVAVIDPRDGMLRWEVKGHHGSITDLEVNRWTGEVFSASWDGKVTVWQEGRRLRQFFPFQMDAGEWVTCMKLLCQLKLIACGSSGGKLIFVEMATGCIVRKMKGHTEYISSLTVRDDGELLISASWDHTVQLWDTKSGQPIGEPLRGHTKVVNCVALSADGNLIASGSMDKNVRLWDAQKGVDVCATLNGHSGSVGSVLFSREGDVLFSGGVYEILVWDLRAGLNSVSMRQKMSHDIGYVTSLCLSHDGDEFLAMSEWSSKVAVWRTKVQKEARCSNAFEGSFASEIAVFGISPNGDIMATCSRSSHDKIDIRRVCDVSGGIDNILCSLPSTEVYWVRQVAVTNDMKLVAYCEGWDNATVYVAQVSTGKVVHELTGLSDWMHSLGEKYPLGDVSTVMFDSEGLIVMAEARVRQYSDYKWVSKSMRWRTSTGQPCPVERGTSAITIEEYNSGTIIEGERSQQSSPLRTSGAHMSIKAVQNGQLPLGHEVLVSEGLSTFTAGTLEVSPLCSHYQATTKRLWIANERKGLQCMDLINGPTANLEAVSPCTNVVFQLSPSNHNEEIPAPSAQKPSGSYTIFISYSGPDKPLADWLYNKLTEMGISVFVAKREIKVGQDTSEAMIDAMEKADVVIVILSPEYPAKKWTMRELFCFRRRVHDAKKKGTVAPVIIPLFFRMGPGMCKSADILDMKTNEGENIFDKYNFFARITKRQHLNDMLDGMRWIGSLQGIERSKQMPKQPRPGQSDVEWLQELQEMLERVVVEADRAVRSLEK